MSKIERSNRTLLELKSDMDKEQTEVLYVPIVPYWNWNYSGDVM